MLVSGCSPQEVSPIDVRLHTNLTSHAEPTQSEGNAQISGSLALQDASDWKNPRIQTMPFEEPSKGHPTKGSLARRGVPDTRATQLSKIQSSKIQAPRGSSNWEGEPIPSHASFVRATVEERESFKILLAHGGQGYPREDGWDARVISSVIQGGSGQVVDSKDKNPPRANPESALHDWVVGKLEEKPIKASPGAFLAVSLLSAEQVVVGVTSTGAICLWDPKRARLFWAGQLSASGMQGKKSSKDSDLTIDAAAVEPNAGMVGFWAGGILRVVELSSGALIREQRQIETRLTSVSFQPQSNAILAAGADGVVYRWKYLEQDGEKNPERYFGPSTVVSALAGYPAGRVFFSGDWSGGLSAWLSYDSDVYQGSYDKNVFRGGLFAEGAARKKAPRSDTVSVTRILVTPDGSAVLAVLQDGRIEWWMTRGFRKIGEVAAHKGEIYAAALSPSGNTLASVGRDGKLKLFTLQFVDGSPPTATFAPISPQDSKGARQLVFTSEKSLFGTAADGVLLSFNF